jgi:hypothetical protein
MLMQFKATHYKDNKKLYLQTLHTMCQQGFQGGNQGGNP